MDILPLLDEIRTIACNGLAFSESPYDIERYQRLLDIASTYYGMSLDLPAAQVRQKLSAELGYITPKVVTVAALFDTEGRLLLELRADDEQWGLPCGFLEANESPTQGVVREVYEETGLEVRPTQLVDVFSRLPDHAHGLFSAVKIVYLCELIAGNLHPSHECKAVCYRQIEDIFAWHEMHYRYAIAAYQCWEKLKSR